MDIRFFAPSYRRPGATSTDSLYPFVRLVVAQNEAAAYQAAAKPGTAPLLICPDSAQGNLCRVRNWILDQNRDADAVILLDDDLYSLGRFVGVKSRRLDADDVLAFADHAVIMARDAGVHFFGVNPMTDKGSYREFAPFSFLGYIGGPFQGHIPDRSAGPNGTYLRYDESLPLKEDYDLTLQHIKKYRKVLRFNAYHYFARQSINKGGCATYRNMANERDQFNRLIEKWGSKIVKTDTQSAKTFDYNPIIRIPIKGI